MNALLKRLPHWGIVCDAAKFSWKHKQLWILGIFAVLIDIGGPFETVLKALPMGDRLGTLLSWDGWTSQLVPLADFWGSAFTAARFGTPEGLIAAFVTAAIVGLTTAFLALLVTMSIGSLVHAVGSAEDGTPPTFAGSARQALKRFWTVFAIIVTVHLILSLAIGDAAMALRWVTTSGGPLAAAAFCLALAVFAIAAVASSILAVLALNEAIMNERPLVEAGVWAWFHLRRHAVAALELAAFILFVSAAAFSVALVILLACGVPLLLLVALFGWLKAPALIALVKALTYFLIYFLAVAAAGFVGVFQVAVWHLFWQRLSHRTFLGKLSSLLHRALNGFRRK